MSRELNRYEAVIENRSFHETTNALFDTLDKRCETIFGSIDSFKTEEEVYFSVKNSINTYNEEIKNAKGKRVPIKLKCGRGSSHIWICAEEGETIHDRAMIIYMPSAICNL